jgi:C4-dicarboxylate-binding protein DctP
VIDMSEWVPGRAIAPFVVACLGAAAVHVAGTTGAAATAEPRVLRIATLQPDGSPQHRSALSFKERVEQASAGTLRIDVHTGSTLHTSPDAIDSLKAGRVEIAAVLLDDLVPVLPAVDVFVQPFLFSNEDILRLAWRRDSPVRRPIDAALRRTVGIRPLWWHHNGLGIAVSNGVPAKRPSDIAGKRVRVFGPTLARWVEACGGTPVLLPVADTPAAMRAGKVDIVLSQLTEVHPHRMYAWAKTLTLVRNTVGGLVFAMSEEVWASLSPVQRAAVEQAAAARDAVSLEEGFTNEAADIAAAGVNGMVIHVTEPHDVADWRICGSSALEQYVDDAGPLGEEIMAGYRRILVDHYQRPSGSARH